MKVNRLTYAVDAETMTHELISLMASAHSDYVRLSATQGVTEEIKEEAGAKYLQSEKQFYASIEWFHKECQQEQALLKPSTDVNVLNNVGFTGTGHNRENLNLLRDYVIAAKIKKRMNECNDTNFKCLLGKNHVKGVAHLLSTMYQPLGGVEIVKTYVIDIGSTKDSMKALIELSGDQLVQEFDKLVIYKEEKMVDAGRAIEIMHKLKEIHNANLIKSEHDKEGTFNTSKAVEQKIGKDPIETTSNTSNAYQNLTHNQKVANLLKLIAEEQGKLNAKTNPTINKQYIKKV